MDFMQNYTIPNFKINQKREKKIMNSLFLCYNKIECDSMIEKFQRNKIQIIIIILLLIVIGLITIKIITQKELIIDKIAYDILVEKLRSPTITLLMKNITKLSNTSIIITLAIIFTIICLYVIKNKKLAISISLNLLAVASLNQILKLIFKRERPIGYRLIEMTGYSFPSGHAMVSMAFYGLLIYIIYRLVKNKYLKVCLISLNIVIIILIGISRIYLGVHYLSDVLTGYCISVIYLLILTKILNRYKVFP